MGELRGDELAKLMQWWRDAYADANETVTVGSFGTVRRTPEQRQVARGRRYGWVQRCLRLQLQRFGILPRNHPALEE